MVLEQDRTSVGPAISELVEVATITNPTLRARDVELLSDSRPGLRREGPGTPRHAVSDHREAHRRELERHFAARIAEETARVWRRYEFCVLVVAASPVMLGMLRTALNREIHASDQLRVEELPRDLTKLSPPALHDLLADFELLPERRRRAPVISTPGLPM
jgi:protein required for attachment to host cells